MLHYIILLPMENCKHKTSFTISCTVSTSTNPFPIFTYKKTFIFCAGSWVWDSIGRCSCWCVLVNIVVHVKYLILSQGVDTLWNATG